LLILQFARVLGYVIFPVFTHMRNRPGNLAHGLSQTLRYVSLITIPLGLGLALIARPLTLVFFTSKWTDAIPAIQGIAIYAMLLSLAYNVGDAYKAEGRPQIITWLSLFQLGLLLPGLWWVVNRAGSIGAVGAMHALVAFISVVATWLVAFRLLKIKLQTFIDALRPAIIAGSTMAVVVQGVLVLSSSALPWQQLSIAILSGGITYCMVLWLFQRKVVLEVADQLRAVLVRGN
jgi:O-antigen/teichoic acid export membrane protein